MALYHRWKIGTNMLVSPKAALHHYEPRTVRKSLIVVNPLVELTYRYCWLSLSAGSHVWMPVSSNLTPNVHEPGLVASLHFNTH
jgi:hypothetical protein